MSRPLSPESLVLISDPLEELGGVHLDGPQLRTPLNAVDCLGITHHLNEAHLLPCAQAGVRGHAQVQPL